MNIPSHGRPHGFTLTEVLVVVAIIGVLLAIVFPFGSRSFQHALQARCANNLKQVAVGLLAYANDHSGQLPGFGSLNQNHSSLGPINGVHRKILYGGYLPNTDAFFCPADKIRRPLREPGGERWAPNPEQGKNNYGFSGYFHMYHRIGSLPTSTIPDEKERWRLTNNPKSIITSCQWKYGPFEAFHESGGINALRLGGAIEWFPESTLKAGRTDAANLYYRLEN